MALIIEGMEIPADCCDCQVRDHEYGECQILGRRTYGVPPRDCPIKGEIPDKHGTLKDVDSFIAEMEDFYCKNCPISDDLNCRNCIVNDVLSCLKAEEVVVEATE